MKRMKSKLHGFTHAYDGNEEAYLRKLGWIEENESFPDEVTPVVEAAETAPKEAPRAKPARKPRTKPE